MKETGRSVRVVALLLLCAFGLIGCASMSEGVTRALMGRNSDTAEKQDTRACYIDGPAFSGIADLVAAEEPRAQANPADANQHQVKIMMVHGIGDHQPGYAMRLESNLAKALGLNVRAERFKYIQLSHPVLFPGMNLGSLRVSSYTNKEGTRSMLFYELTWTPVIEKEKALLAYDNSGLYALRRASINGRLKDFTNSHLPDPLIYFGDLREPIQTSVGQALCWAMSRDWNDLPNSGVQYCDTSNKNMLSQAQNDQYVFVSHSLGSRVLVDSLQRLVRLATASKDPSVMRATRHLREKNIKVFMLSNQLPLLQLGQPKPEVTGHFAEYCTAQGPRRDERLFRRTEIVAFSDPNDILSYAVPPGYADQYMDTRLCVALANVVINIAPVTDIFGLGELANPLTAHTDYDDDERVLALIVRGIGTESAAPIIKQRCEWTETR